MSNSIFPTKKPSEDLTLAFDFLGQVPAGETIVLAGCEVLVFTGFDANPSAILSGTASLSGSNILQDVVGGLVGVVYLLNCEIETSGGAILINSAKLAIISDNPFLPDV